ncbi:MAG: DUF2179 domain-containing protein [Firmicutes bacterium]|nr:DUF2179 domain-containing protein [Bacillota bacterium]
MLLTLCLKIFFVRILDVSLGTVRTIISVKGQNLLASIIGFVEITIWFLVVKEAINTENTSLWIVFSYASGFSVGTYIGGLLSSKFIEGNLGVQIITGEHNYELIDILRKEGYGVTVIDVKGQNNSGKYMLFIEINNKNFNHLKNIVKKHDSQAFIVVNETKYVQNGYLKK